MEQSRRYHNHLSEYIIAIAKELRVDTEDILVAIRWLPSAAVLNEKDTRIWNLEKEHDILSSRVNWVEGELAQVKLKEKEALQLIKNLTELITQPFKTVTKAALLESKLAQEGSLTGSLVVRILVDYNSRMEKVLEEMRHLLGNLDPNRAMDFSQFPEVPYMMESPFKRTPVKPPQAGLSGLKGVVPLSSATSSQV